MKIIHLHAEDYKRLSVVDIEPDGSVVEISGRNGQGKTSVLDCIWAALAGAEAIAQKPIREGSEKASIRLDLGEYVVERRFWEKDGQPKTSITVSNPDGARYTSPQTLLDGLMGKLSFDPLAFARMKPRDQAEQLRALVPDFDFKAMEAANKADFDARTAVNRDALKLSNEMERLADDVEVPDDVPDRDALDEEFRQATLRNGDAERQHLEIQNRESRIREKSARVEETEREISDLKSQIAIREERLTQLGDEISALQDELVHFGPPIEKIDLRSFDERMEQARRYEGVLRQRERRAEVQRELKEAKAESDQLTAAMAARKADAREAVAKANLPIDGMELNEDGLQVGGHPFAQLSDAEQLQISIAVAAQLNPKLRIIRVRDGSLLDSASMAALHRYADEHNVQVWIERVSDGAGPGIVIEDGTVACIQEAAE